MQDSIIPYNTLIAIIVEIQQTALFMKLNLILKRKYIPIMKSNVNMNPIQYAGLPACSQSTREHSQTDGVAAAIKISHHTTGFLRVGVIIFSPSERGSV